MLVVGVDPGTATTGYSLVAEDAEGDLRLVRYGVFETRAGDLVEGRHADDVPVGDARDQGDFVGYGPAWIDQGAEAVDRLAVQEFNRAYLNNGVAGCVQAGGLEVQGDIGAGHEFSDLGLCDGQPE